jgi:hypothetical protein
MITPWRGPVCIDVFPPKKILKRRIRKTKNTILLRIVKYIPAPD